MENISFVYFAASELFLRYPLLINKFNIKKYEYSTKPFGIYIGAHRGGSHEGVENTLGNIRLS